jgi:hypothetical protein
LGKRNLFYQPEQIQTMTQIAIQQQIEVIKKANQDARKTKEAARKFLIDAGIIKEATQIKSSDQKKK